MTDGRKRQTPYNALQGRQNIAVGESHGKGLNDKYRQAALVYLVNGINFFLSFKEGIHDFGLWTSLLFSVGILMVVVFPVLIYKGYRRFTMVLTVVYGIRIVVTIPNLPFITSSIIFGLVLLTLTCFMLARAAWDIDLKFKI